MELPVYYLELNEGDGLTQVSLVSAPAIEENFHAFAEHFVKPKEGESESEFISRCIPVLIGEGKEQEQAAAICYSYWEDRTAMESYTDYPEAAKANAERGIRLNEETGNKCATQVGKVRAQQIANGEPLSEETIKRTYSFLSRAREYYKPDEPEACGTISYLLWGGDEMLRWAESKVSKMESRQAFAIQSEEKRIITGPAMLAERPIYRRGPDGSEYYVKFSAATIEKAVRLWATQGKYNAVNAEHSSPVGGLFLMESFITDPARGINPPEAWKDAPAGSWFLSYYVQDDALWQKVKSGEFRGFSIEGYFTDKPADEDAESLTAMRALTEIFLNIENQPLTEMNAKEKLTQIRALLGFSEEAQAAPAENPVAFGEGQLADGTAIRWQGETLESGALLEVMAEDGTWVPAPDGTHETADGQLVTTEGGIVTEIMLKEGDEMPDNGEDMAAEFAAIKSEYAAKFEAQESAIARLTAAIENLTKAQTQTLEVIEQFSAIPSGEPVKKPNGIANPQGFSASQMQDRFIENLKKIKQSK